MVVGIAGVGCGYLFKEWGCVLALTACGDALVVDHLRQREAAGDEGKCGCRLGVFCVVEAGEAEVEAGFESYAVIGLDLCERGGGCIVLACGVLLLAEGKKRRGVVWRLGDCGLQALQTLLFRRGRGTADVVLEGAEAHAARGCEECLLGHREVRVHLLRDLPGDGVFYIEEPWQLTRIEQRRGHLQLVYVQYLRLYFDMAGGCAGVGDMIAADDDEVSIERLGDADGGGSTRLEARGQAEVVERILAVIAADGEEAGGGEALVESVRERVADPVQVGLAGAVVEGKDEDEAAAGLADVGSGGEAEGAAVGSGVGACACSEVEVRGLVCCCVGVLAWARAIGFGASAASITASERSLRVGLEIRLCVVLTTIG